jgi:4-hydroxy-tetrahydrodipicolinate synthase
MKLRPLTGTITALATPFRDGQVSYKDLKKLVAHQLKGGIDGLVPVGTKNTWMLSSLWSTRHAGACR